MSDTPAEHDRTSASRGDDRGRGTGRGRRDDSSSGGRSQSGGRSYDRGGSANRSGSSRSGSGRGGASDGGPRRDSSAQGRGRPQSGDGSPRRSSTGGPSRSGGPARSGDRDRQRDGNWNRDGQRGGAGGGSRDGQYKRDGQSGGQYRRDGQSGGSRYSRDGGDARGGQRDRPQRDGAPRGDRPQRDGGSRQGNGSRQGGSWDSNRKPNAGGGYGTRSGGHDGRSGGARSGGGRAGAGRSDDKLWTKGGRPARGDRDARDHEYELTEEEKRARELRSVRPRHDDPDLPADVEARDLAKEARIELKTLSKDNAEWVAQHLVMASRLIDTDPELAHRHAMSASRRAGRIGVVRETLAITAYATGDFALALRELRTYRRITGSNDQIALMVDSERGVGRPDRALELGRSVDRASLPSDVQVSLAIAMSGARLDLDQDEAALAELEIPQLDPNRAFSWSPDLFHAYAEVLEALGRDADAATWRERAERAELALEEAHADAELETIHVIEEDFEFEGEPDADEDRELEGEPDDGAVSTDE